ncbi:MAG: hypothetical protein V3U25_02880 [Nitrososphaerales archaeon]
MPLEVVCGACDEVLYKGSDFKSPREVLKMLGGRCNKCGEALSTSEFSIDITSTRS